MMIVVHETVGCTATIMIFLVPDKYLRGHLLALHTHTLCTLYWLHRIDATTKSDQIDTGCEPSCSVKIVEVNQVSKLRAVYAIIRNSIVVKMNQRVYICIKGSRHKAELVSTRAVSKFQLVQIYFQLSQVNFNVSAHPCK